MRKIISLILLVMMSVCLLGCSGAKKYTSKSMEMNGKDASGFLQQGNFTISITEKDDVKTIVLEGPALLVVNGNSSDKKWTGKVLEIELDKANSAGTIAWEGESLMFLGDLVYQSSDFVKVNDEYVLTINSMTGASFQTLSIHFKK